MLLCDRRRVAFFFLATMLASPAATEQQTAETFLKEIYETFDTHPLRGQQVYEQADRFFVPEVVAVIARYDDRDLPRYVGAYYWNPFTNDNSGSASDISIKVT